MTDDNEKPLYSYNEMQKLRAEAKLTLVNTLLAELNARKKDLIEDMEDFSE